MRFGCHNGPDRQKTSSINTIFENEVHRMHGNYQLL